MWSDFFHLIVLEGSRHVGRLAVTSCQVALEIDILCVLTVAVYHVVAAVLDALIASSELLLAFTGASGQVVIKLPRQVL